MRKVSPSRWLAIRLVTAGVLLGIAAGFVSMPVEASHPHNYAYGNRAIGVNWLFNCVCWDNDVLDWMGGWATPGLDSRIKNSSYYPSSSSAWNDANYPRTWVTKDVPGNGGEVFTVIYPRPAGACSENEPCQTHVHEWFVDDAGQWHELRLMNPPYSGWVDHVDLHYYSTTDTRCHNSFPGDRPPQGFYDCVATTISHEVGHSLFLEDHTDGIDSTIMQTPPRPRQVPTSRDKQVAGQCIYLDNC